MAKMPLNALLQSAENLNLGSQLQTAGMVAELQAASMIGEAARQATASAAAAAVQPVEPLIQPTFSKAADSYGVMRHIDPVRDHFLNARIGIEALRRIALEGVGSKSRSLLQRVEDYLKKHLPEAEYAALMGQLGIEKGAPTTLLKKALPTLGSKFRIPLREKPGAPNNVELVEVEHNTHSALFGAGAVVSDDIRSMEALRLALINVRRRQQKVLADAQADLAEIEARVPAERSRLDVLNRTRSESLDDYVVAQRLLADHWHSVEEAHRRRQQVIESNVGLFYVKQRETPLTHTLPDPLELRFTSADDLVPGCANRETPLAEDLEPFMEAVLDIPAADWATLRELSHLLPSRSRLERMVGARRQRVALRLSQSAAVPAGALQGIVLQNRILLGDIAGRPFSGATMRDLQMQGHQILALEDLLAGPVPLLREPARALHQRLDAAAGCLLARLRSISPSLRLIWASAAEADRLVVDAPERWPGIAQAEAADFNGIRTLAELVAWWFRQLHAEAGGASRTAMRNFVRACLLLAIGDDPDELLQGRLRTLPGRFRIGEALRLDLNRVPPPGAELQLVDDAQRVIGMVRVDDHDANGTLASITQVLDAGASLTTSFRVSGTRRP